MKKIKSLKMILGLAVLAFLAAACEPQVVEVEKEVQVEVTVEVEKIVEVEKEVEKIVEVEKEVEKIVDCLLYTSPSPRDKRQSRMPSSA